ncbi:AEC family transporter [Desulfobacterales bacterium HSG16]|nr:AEC family transporter [Desulfobacterales bacterium HSG16]
MNVMPTIIPIFCVIAIGWLARKKGFMPSEFLEPANRLVFYVAIPAMIFSAVSRASFVSHFHPPVLGITLLAAFCACVCAWLIGLMMKIRREEFGSFIQSSFHGNLGYVGLAVAYYYLGEQGFVQAGIIAGFLMILQNLLAVMVLQIYGGGKNDAGSFLQVLYKVAGNPIIIAAIAGICFSLSGLSMPIICERILQIISGMALPMALLIIGASLSFGKMRTKMNLVAATGLIKLVLLPGAGFMMYRLAGTAPDIYLPGLILLATPTATVTYVMAKEMNGDADIAVAAISLNTLASAVTFSIWLNAG